MRLWLIRHPAPSVASGVCYGISDVACAVDDIRSCAQSIAGQLPEGLPILSSPLQRCEHLAQSLQGQREDLVYTSVAALTEMDFGAWEMRSWDAIAPTQLQDWAKDFANYRCGQTGQSAGQFVQQVAGQLALSLQAGWDQAWVTHAGVIRALLWLRRQEGFDAWAAQAQHGQPCVLSLSALLARLRAADWPQDALPFGRSQPWEWPDCPA